MVQEKKNLKITVIGPTAPYKGGIAHFNTLLYQNLKEDYNVNIISWKRRYPNFLLPAEQLDKNSKKEIKANAAFILDCLNPYTWWKAVRNIKKHKSDLVILHWVTPFMTPIFSFISFFVHKLSKAKILLICHNVKPHENRKLDKILSKIMFYFADYFIVHSKEDLINLKKYKKTNKVKLGFHPTYSIFAFDDKIKNKKLQNRILFFGFVRKYKGLEYLIKAMPLILKKQKIELLIVGEFWEGKKEYLELIEKLNLKDNIKIIDQYVPNEVVAKYFSKSDVTVLPYVSGTQSGIIQLSFGLNTPVISTKVGGFDECVKDGVTGYLVAPKDSKALANAIIKFYKERKIETFSENIKQQKDKFSWKNYIKLINELVKN